MNVSCIPFPHRQHDFPKVYGQLTVGDRHKEGVQVLISHPANRRCEKPIFSTMTDDKGKFNIPSSGKFKLFLTLGDRKDTWSLCFKDDDFFSVLMQEGYWGGPKKETLICTIKTLKKSDGVIKLEHYQKENTAPIECNIN